MLNPLLPDDSLPKQVLLFVGEPVVSMLISVLVAMYTLGIQRGKSMEAVTELLVDSIKEVAMLFLIFGGAGALKQVLTDAGVSHLVRFNDAKGSLTSERPTDQSALGGSTGNSKK